MKPSNILYYYPGVDDRLAIEAAKKLGHNIYLLIGSERRQDIQRLLKLYRKYPHEIMSEEIVYPYDKKQKEKFKKVIRKIKKVFSPNIVFPGSGFAGNNYVEFLSKINMSMKIPFPIKNPSVFADKHKYLKKLKKIGIKTPHLYFKIDPQKNFDDRILEKIKYPCICKPSRGTGGWGIYVAQNIAELKHFFSYEESAEKLNKSQIQIRDKNKYGIRRYNFHSEGSSYIIEEFINGTTISVCGNFIKQIPFVDLIYEIESSRIPYQAETGFLHPAPNMNASIEEDIFRICEKIGQILNFPNGPFMVDFILKDDDLYLIDLAPRLSSSGNRLSYYVYGKNNFHCENAVKILTGETGSIKKPKEKRAVVFRNLDLPKGTVSSAKRPEKLPSFVNFVYLPKVGKKIFENRNDLHSRERGCIIVSGENLLKAKKNWKTFHDMIDIKVKGE